MKAVPGCTADRYCGGTVYPPMHHGTRRAGRVTKLRYTGLKKKQNLVPSRWAHNYRLVGSSMHIMLALFGAF